MIYKLEKDNVRLLGYFMEQDIRERHREYMACTGHKISDRHYRRLYRCNGPIDEFFTMWDLVNKAVEDSGLEVLVEVTND